MDRMEPLATLMLKWMAERHLDQKDAAKVIGCAAGTVSRWVSGDRKPSFVDAIKIARAMRCSLDELGGLVVKTHQRAALDELISQLGEKRALSILLEHEPDPPPSKEVRGVAVKHIAEPSKRRANRNHERSDKDREPSGRA